MDSMNSQSRSFPTKQPQSTTPLPAPPPASAAQAERLDAMRSSFLPLLQQGLSPKEIAWRFNLSSDAATEYLREITPLLGDRPPDVNYLPQLSAQDLLTHDRYVGTLTNIFNCLGEYRQATVGAHETFYNTISKEVLSWDEA